jgi:hydroxypyruvate isomerase
VPRFSANLTFLFNERPFLERFSAAAAVGFRSIEFMSPYESSASELARQLNDHSLDLDLFNLPAGDFAAGERGLAVFPTRRDEFRAGVQSALGYAQALRTLKLNCLVGLRDAALTWEQQYACLVENLRWAAALVGRGGRTLLVEQLNPADAPGFFLDSLSTAERLLDDVASPHLLLQFDAYHVQRTHGDVVGHMRRLIGRVGHVQVADSPDRHEPGTGELNYEFILRELDRLGYQGRVGLEYRPSGSTENSFGWIAEHGWSTQ